jgi:nitric oxide reductase subunit B
VNLTFFYFAIPRLKAMPGGRFRERRGAIGFWTASLAVLGLSLSFAVAGVLQAYLERFRGEPYLVAQEPIRFWMAIVFAHGVVALLGVVIIAWDLLTMKPAAAPAD